MKLKKRSAAVTCWEQGEHCHQPRKLAFVFRALFFFPSRIGRNAATVAVASSESLCSASGLREHLVPCIIVYRCVRVCARLCVCVCVNHFEVKAVELAHGSAVPAEGFLPFLF